MMVGDATGMKPHRDLTVDEVTPEALRRICMGVHPETELAIELWPTLSDGARRWLLGHIQVGDFDCGIEFALMDAVDQGVVVPQWVIDTKDKLEEHWGWSPNVEKACAALQARLDEHNRGGGE